MPFEKGNKQGQRFGKDKQPAQRKPRGKSKMASIVEELKSIANEVVEDGKGGKMTRKEVIARVLMKLAAQGDIKAIQLVTDRLDGRAPETITHSIEGDMTVHGMGATNITIVTND